MYLQWLFFKRIFAGHSPLRLTALMTVGNVLVGIGSFYYLSQIIGQHGLRGQIYQEFGGLAGFLAVGIAMNAMLTVGCNSIARAITDEQAMGTLSYWMMCRPHILTLVIRSSIGEFLLIGVNAIITFALMVLVFQVHFHVNLLAFAVVFVTSLLFVGGIGLWAAGLFIGGFKGQNPVLWAFGLTTNFMSGVFAPVQIFQAQPRVFNLPVLYWVCMADPVTHALLAMRAAILRNASLGDSAFTFDLGFMALFTAIVLPLGIWQFQRGLAKALEQNKLIES